MRETQLDGMCAHPRPRTVVNLENLQLQLFFSLVVVLHQHTSHNHVIQGAATHLAAAVHRLR